MFEQSQDKYQSSTWNCVETERSKSTCRYSLCWSSSFLWHLYMYRFGGRASLVRNLYRKTADEADCIFTSGEVQVPLWIFRCVTTVFLVIRFLCVVKLTTRTHHQYFDINSYSKLSIWKISSLFNFALKSPNGIFTWCLRQWYNACYNSP